MENRKEYFKDFSIKKLLLSILFSVIVTTFIGFTILFGFSVPELVFTEVMANSDKSSDVIKEFAEGANELYENFESGVKEDKSMYGNEYPAEGILLTMLMCESRSYNIVYTYTITFLVGVVLGTIIYIIFVQKAKGKQMIVETLLCLGIIFIVILFINFGYKIIVNKLIDYIGRAFENRYATNVYDSEYILITFIIVLITMYLYNLIDKKILTSKLNKELNKKN